MATIVLGTVGGFVGGAIGGPGGAKIGWSVGTLIGAGIEGSRAPTQELNRLQDLRVSGSAFGTPIPIVYGRHLVSANCIYAGPMRETSKKTGVRLLGTRRRTFSYTISLALSWCRGPITRVRRIWADDLLIYDYAAADPDGKYQIANYEGTETQIKDPTIEEDKGTANTPAYRGQAYSVIKDMPLSEFGNRIPNFKAEVEAIPSYAEVVLADSPLMYYRFEDSPGKLQDSGSKGYHLADVGGTSTQTPGAHGEGVIVASGDSVEDTVGSDSDLQDGTISVEAWWKYKGGGVVDGGGHFEYVNPDTSEFAWDLFVTPNLFTEDIHVRFRVFTNASGVTEVFNGSTGYVVSTDTEWHHTVVTYDQAGNALLYVDGELVDTEAAPVNPIAITADADNKVYVTGNDIRWDELAFYGTILDAETVAAHYSQAVRVSDVISDVCEQVGLEAADLAVSAASDHVRGYLVAGRTEARSALAPLLQVYFTDLAEVDGQIKAVKRGGAVAATISADDLGCKLWSGAGGEPESLVNIRLAQPLELPLRVDLNYYSTEKDYEQSTQSDVRYTQGGVDNLVTVATPLVLTETEARQMAIRLLYDAWLARETYQFSLPWSYAHLAPGDVVNLPVGASLRRVRITQLDMSMTFGPIKVTAVLDDAGILTQVATGSTVETSDEDSVVQVTVLKAWSNNAIVNEDADAVGYYVAAAGATDGYWAGALLYQSTDGGASYQEVGPLEAPAIHGTTVGALAAGTTTGLWDDTNTVDVTILNGSIESASDAEVLAGENFCRIGSEYLSFGTVTPQGGAVYRLSHLLRGARGTDSLWGTHAAGDVFVLLEEGLYTRVSVGFGLRGKDILLKAVTDGTTLADTTAVPLTVTGAEFTPYAPVDIQGTRDGSDNLTVTWHRRTRKAEGLQDMADEPLAEDTEAYEVEILAATPDRVISVTAETATYTAAAQTSDGLTPGDPVTVTVYQIGRYGRGYGRTETI